MQLKKIKSESDLLLESLGYDLWDEYLEMYEKAEFENGSLILDLGSGSGRGLGVMVQLGHPVVTVDYDANQIEKARKRLEGFEGCNVVFLQYDFYNLMVPDKSIMNIVCGNVLHECDEPLRLIEEIKRILGKGGKLLLFDFNDRGFEVMEKLHNEVYGDKHNTGSLRISEAERYFNGGDFEIMKINTILNDALIIKRL